MTSSLFGRTNLKADDLISTYLVSVHNHSINRNATANKLTSITLSTYCQFLQHTKPHHVHVARAALVSKRGMKQDLFLLILAHSSAVL